MLNRSDIDVVIDSYDFNVKVNTTPVSRIASSAPVNLRGRAKTVLPLKVDFSPREVLGQAINLANITAIARGDLKITIDGVVSVSHAGIKATNIPVKISKRLKDMTSGAPTECKL